MRYFDQDLIASSRPHQAWWTEVCNTREWFHLTEEAMATATNAAAVLPRDAWLDFDDSTRRIMRQDEGQAFMVDLMPLAKPVNIGKLVHVGRVSSDAGAVTRSMSGQVPTSLDKVEYAYRGNPVPIFSSGYGRTWREWNTQQSENFDALADDDEAISAKINRDQALYVLNGDDTLTVGGYRARGIMNHELSKSINLGDAAGGADIDLTAASSDDIEAFVNGALGAMLDDNKIPGGINLYISPEIARHWDKPYSGSSGFKTGSLLDFILGNRRINKIAVTFELTGNQFFGFVPSAEYIRPLIGMAVNTTALTRHNPTDDYNFLKMGAMGLDIRADFAGNSGVFYSVVVNA